MAERKKKASPQGDGGQPKKPKKDFYDPARTLHHIIPGVYIAVAVLLGFFVVADLFGGNDSPLGRGSLNILKGLFSTGIYIIPLLLLWRGIAWQGDVQKKRVISRGVYHLLFLIMYGALWFCFSRERHNLAYSARDLYLHGVDLSGGGFIGGSLGFVLYTFTGYIGVPFLTIVLILLYCYQFLGISPHTLLEKYKARRQAQQVQAEEVEEELIPQTPARSQDTVDDGLFPADHIPEAPMSAELSPTAEEELRQTHQAEQREETPKMTWKERRAKRRAERERRKASSAPTPSPYEDEYYPSGEEQSFEELFRQLGREALTIQRQSVRGQSAPSTPPEPATPAPQAAPVAVEDDEYFTPDVEEQQEYDAPAPQVAQPTFEEEAPVASGAQTADQIFGAFNPLSQDAVINTTPTLLRPESDPMAVQTETLRPVRPEPQAQPLDRSQYHTVPGGIKGNGEGMGSFMIRTQHMDIPSTRNPRPAPQPEATPTSTFEEITTRVEDTASSNTLPYVHPATPAAEQEQVAQTPAPAPEEAGQVPPMAQQMPPMGNPYIQNPYYGYGYPPMGQPYGQPYPPQGMYGQMPYGQPYMPPYGMAPTGQPMQPQQAPVQEPPVAQPQVQSQPKVETPIVATDHVAEHPLREQTIVTPTAPKAPAPKAEAPKKNTSYDNHLFPPLSLLTRSVPITNANSQAEIEETSARLVGEFRKFKHEITVHEVTIGPRVTRYSISPPDGVRMSTIIGLANDIALGLSVRSIRIDPVPNTPYLGVEIPTRTPQTVRLSSLIDTAEFRGTKTVTTVPLGANITGAPVFADIAKMPHVLIAGATGMGKSVLMNSILLSLLYKARPDEIKMILIDPKRVEMSMYNGIPHLLIPPVVEPQKAAGALIWATGEMERRYHLMESAGTRSIEGYNEAVKNGRVQGEKQPKIIIVIDELNDLMMQARDAVEPAITSIAQKARAAGIHLIIGTQRPSVDVITGLIKANIPSRIALHVSSGTDSRTILDAYGAEKLLDKGDMLAVISGAEAIRVQSAFVSDEEVENVTSFLRQNAGACVYDETVSAQIDSETEKYRNSGKRASDRSDDEDGESDGSYFEDSAFMKACEVALNNSKISTSLLQRTCGLGYGKAAKFIDQMEIIGLVSAPNGQKPRDVLMSRDQFMEMVSRETYTGD